MQLEQKLSFLREKLLSVFGDQGTEIVAAKAPGRVNLIGEHTDYNDGFVFPMAIDRQIVLVGQANSESVVRIYSADFDSHVEFSLENITKDSVNTWSNYLRGVIKLLQEAGHSVVGMNLVMSGDVPQGAGLSSSAALEVGTAYLTQLISGFDLDKVAMAKLCQRAENTFVGVNCGIMDQFISALGAVDHALFLDCRSLDYELVPLPSGDEYKIVICNTAVKRGLVDSAYNERRSQCEEGVALLQEYLPEIKALRDVTVAEFEQYKGKLPELVARRCAHVICENQRVLDSVAALKAKDVAKFGQLMYESHVSLRDLYEVSCKELDIMVELAQKVDGVVGARMTGAGFGGCTVNLVRADAVDGFVEQVSKEYQAKTQITPEIYVSTARDGAAQLKVE